jgi:SAM-dependent methyltransferase
MKPTSQSQLMKSPLKEPDPHEDHFQFGENWTYFARGLDDDAKRGAEEALARLAGSEALRAQSFLDIGCGSGLHALAALRLGASRVLVADLDPVSVRTTETVLRARRAPGGGRGKSASSTSVLITTAASTWSNPGVSCTTREPCIAPLKRRPQWSRPVVS